MAIPEIHNTTLADLQVVIVEALTPAGNTWKILRSDESQDSITQEQIDQAIAELESEVDVLTMVILK